MRTSNESPALVERNPIQRVRLSLRGVALAWATLDRIDADGLHVRLPNPSLSLGTYVEIEIPGSGVEGVGTMVTQHSSHGIGLIFTSWSPHVFDLIVRLVEFRYPGLADASHAATAGQGEAVAGS